MLCYVKSALMLEGRVHPAGTEDLELRPDQYLALAKRGVVESMSERKVKAEAEAKLAAAKAEAEKAAAAEAEKAEALSKKAAADAAEVRAADEASAKRGGGRGGR